MRQASVYTPYEIKEWPAYEEFVEGCYRPARPLGFSGFTFKRNLYVAWQVFLGRWDALKWESTIGYERPKKSSI